MLDDFQDVSVVFCVDTGQEVQTDRARMQKTGNLKVSNVVLDWRESGIALMILQIQMIIKE